jgi:isocitrate lyase
MTLVHLYLLRRYKVSSVHYVAPTDDNAAQCERMKAWGIYSSVSNEVGAIIVAQVDRDAVSSLTATDSDGVAKLIRKQDMTPTST